MSSNKIKKCTKAQMHTRVSEVLDMLRLQHSRYEIVQHGSKKWNISERQVDDYIAQAKEIIMESNKSTSAETKANILSGLGALLRAAIFQKDVRTARQIYMDIAKLQGLDQTTINVNVQRDEDLMKMSDDELDSILGQATH